MSVLTRREIERVVALALDEDAPWGDLTSNAFLDASSTATADLNAREPGVFAGGEVFEAAFTLLDPTVQVDLRVADGARFEKGDVLATVSGPARSVLQSERVGLNFVQRMSGIATLTAQYVAAAGPDVRVADTRKTTPLLRRFERHAVLAGGGHNHRFSLSDAVMAKDNHLAVAGLENVTEAIRSAAAKLPHLTGIEVEVDRVELIEPVLASGEVDVILLDNFTLDDLREGVRLVAGRAVVEASGGVTLDSIGEIARTGVDVISVGALTHGYRSLDLGLDVRVSAEPT